ncbi:MAG: HAD superfamily hydrolase (TIGR01509 family) [Gammaproteobacteria bacterium]|jgi:HAD superfamily hydrolase (TIGR01509 family)
MNPDLRVIRENIDAIIFDFGGVLFDIDYQAPVREFIKLGAKNFDTLYSKKAQSASFDQLEKGEISESDFWRGLSKVLEMDVTCAQMEQAWNSILIGIEPSRAVWLEEIQKVYRSFILSNTNSIHVRAFEQMIDQDVGIRKFKNGFEKVYYSNEIGMRKPSAEIFNFVLEQNSLDPKKTLFIDDSIQHVEGARLAGLNAFHLDLEQTNIETVLKTWVPL